MKYREQVTDVFAPTRATPCWSVYVAAVGPEGGIYTHGHAYGRTEDEATDWARRDLERKMRREMKGKMKTYKIVEVMTGTVIAVKRHKSDEAARLWLRRLLDGGIITGIAVKLVGPDGTI